MSLIEKNLGIKDRFCGYSLVVILTKRIKDDFIVLLFNSSLSVYTIKILRIDLRVYIVVVICVVVYFRVFIVWMNENVYVYI